LMAIKKMTKMVIALLNAQMELFGNSIDAWIVAMKFLVANGAIQIIIKRLLVLLVSSVMSSIR
jgi:hypothetical protein